MASDNNFEEVQVGYCMNDDMISYLSDFKKIYYSYQRFNTQKLSKLRFPLRRISKLEMLNILKKETNIINFIFSCENPKINNTPCGKCHPCIRYEALHKEHNCLYDTNLLRTKIHEINEREYYESKTILNKFDTSEILKPCNENNLNNDYKEILQPEINKNTNN